MQEDEDYCVGRIEREDREKGGWMVPKEGIGLEFRGPGDSPHMDLNTPGFGLAASFAACCFLCNPQPHEAICVSGFLEGMMPGR